MVTGSKPSQNARLIVLLPESLAGDLEFAHLIHRMAVQENKDVLYLTLMDNTDNLLGVSRQIATMKAVTESNLIRAGSVQVPVAYWFGKLRDIIRPGDAVVCHEEQVVKQGFLKTEPISEFLNSVMDQPISTVKNFYHPQRIQVKRWLLSGLFWIGAVGILTGFSLLEVQTGLVMPGSINKLVLAAMILIEFGAVWFWSRIFHP